MTAAARSSSAPMSARMASTSARSGPAVPGAARNRRPASALARMAASGWVSSWASDAPSSPTVATRLRCVSSWVSAARWPCAARSAACARWRRRRSVSRAAISAVSTTSSPAAPAMGAR